MSSIWDFLYFFRKKSTRRPSWEVNELTFFCFPSDTIKNEKRTKEKTNGKYLHEWYQEDKKSKESNFQFSDACWVWGLSKRGETKNESATIGHFLSSSEVNKFQVYVYHCSVLVSFVSNYPISILYSASPNSFIRCPCLSETNDLYMNVVGFSWQEVIYLKVFTYISF